MEVILIILLVLYLIPSSIAQLRKAEHKNAILFINFFLGWTFIIWFVCLVWAFLSPSKNKKSEENKVTNVQNQVSIACGNCSEIIKIGDTFCSKCGEKLQVTIIDNNENIETNNDKKDQYDFGLSFSDDLGKLPSLYQRTPSYIKVAFFILIISIGMFFLVPRLYDGFIHIWIEDRLLCYNCETDYYIGENSDFLVRSVIALSYWYFIINIIIGLHSLIFIIYTFFVPIKDSFKNRFTTTLKNKLSYYIFLSIPISLFTYFFSVVILNSILAEFSNFNGVIDVPADYIAPYVIRPISWISLIILILFPPIFLYRFQKTHSK